MKHVVGIAALAAWGVSLRYGTVGGAFAFLGIAAMGSLLLVVRPARAR